jgi:hypothetical protein
LHQHPYSEQTAGFTYQTSADQRFAKAVLPETQIFFLQTAVCLIICFAPHGVTTILEVPFFYYTTAPVNQDNSGIN